MSRRIRTKMKRLPFQMGLNHHKEYSETTTSFPHSYSILGNPISMPSKIMPLFSDGNFNLNSTADTLGLESQQIQKEQKELKEVREANISVSGKIKKMNNRFITTFIFILSMCCCCLFKLFRVSFVRNSFYTKYSMDLDNYQQLAKIILCLKNCNHFIINIQDNQLNPRKLSLLQNALVKNQSPQKLILVIRNYCYNMQNREAGKCSLKWFQNIEQMENIDFAFVWQNLVLKSKRTNKKGKSEQEQTLISSVLNC